MRPCQVFVPVYLQGSMQAAVAQAVLLTYIMLTLVLWPFALREDNWLQLASLTGEGRGGRGVPGGLLCVIACSAPLALPNTWRACGGQPLQGTGRHARRAHLVGASQQRQLAWASVAAAS